MKYILIIYTIVSIAAWAQDDTYDSGGPLMPEQAAYDVTFYELALSIDPHTQSIAGSNSITSRVILPFSQFVLDFDARFTIDSVLVSDSDNLVLSTFERKGSKIYINVQKQVHGTLFKAQVHYHGQPRVAPNPPWNGGFSWKTTASGDPWVSVSCQNNGADIWWPCKDHPSDEPDSMAMHFTIPKELQCISSGRLRGVTDNADGTTTFSWFVSTPINNYGMSFYIAPFARDEYQYTSTTGEMFPMTFYYLPEHKDEHRTFAPQIPEHVRFLEETLGPYPFRIDKYAVVEAPYLGMEHQSCIAYGVLGSGGSYDYGQGFDALHFHELSHEWWGNMLTASDWKDFWLHEGFATYMEALYAEHLNGESGYKALMQRFSNGISHRHPIAPTESRTTGQMYGGDIYYKGAWILHTLRYAIGDELFFEALQRFLYPDPALKNVKDGSHCRLVTSEEFIETVEHVSKQKLDWFFHVYLRQAQPPLLQTWIEDDLVHLVWKTLDDIQFTLDVPVKVGDTLYVADMSTGRGTVKLDPFVPPQFDPENKILKHVQRINVYADAIEETEMQYALAQNYPNPFNNETTIEFTLPKTELVEITIHNVRGKVIETLVSAPFQAGTHAVTWDAAGVASGPYTYKITAGTFIDLKKLLLLK